MEPPIPILSKYLSMLMAASGAGRVPARKRRNRPVPSPQAALTSSAVRIGFAANPKSAILEALGIRREIANERARAHARFLGRRSGLWRGQRSGAVIFEERLGLRELLGEDRRIAGGKIADVLAADICGRLAALRAPALDERHHAPKLFEVGPSRRDDPHCVRQVR